jgi:DMSO/TMAO reductase YedYZ molybdopterin-dependent catalytic subunit
VDINSYKLGITGLVNTPRQLTYDQVLGFAKYEKVMDLHCVEGWSVRLLWEGVLVRDLLADAGVKPEAKVVILHAVDGYTSALPLDYFMNNDILLGYKMNGLPLLPERGFPFQLVAESKWGYKWVKWVNEIELSDDVNYRGTWEKAGYSNNGDYSGPMFER